MLFDYHLLRQHILSLLAINHSFITHTNIGSSLEGHPLEIFSFSRTKHPQGRILVTTGCHPAEPDVLGSLAIFDYLLSPSAKHLLNHYAVDVMPMQNPDGFVNHSCLTSNGINLYWNFRHQDKTNYPEAFWLWQYMQKNPPLLYLDFHAYVHQYHRHPMPYLQSLACYTGQYPKQLVSQFDKKLVRLSNGYYRLGSLSMWPHSLSTLATSHLNTICYTKYHFNMFEGIKRSQQRALDIFTTLSNLLLEQSVNQKMVLKPPYGSVKPDLSDTTVWRNYYNSITRLKQARVYIKSYSRYYRYRNRSGLFHDS